MDIINQIMESNRVLFISLTEFMVYTILLSLIVFHLIIYYGRRRFKEGKYYLYFSYFFLGLLLYIFIDTYTYYILLWNFINTKVWTTFFTAVSFLIIYRSIILILNSSLNPGEKSVNLSKRIFKYYALFNLVWLVPLMVTVKHVFVIFWGFNFLFICFLWSIYVPFLIRNSKRTEVNTKIISWLILGYIFYIIISRFIWMQFPSSQVLSFWIVHDVLKIIVALIFSYALAKKTNKEFSDLQELKNNLEKKVKEKTRELQVAKEKIERASEQRTNYFINLAHETKTPLTLISNYLDRYLKRNGTSKELDIIRENFHKLKNEMIRFLDVEKYEKGLVSYEHNQIIELSDLIKQKLPLLNASAQTQNIRVSCDIDDNIKIKSDPAAMESIINNLFENAVKYGETGNEIKIFLKNEDSGIRFSVIDTGIGIEKERLEHIFQPYYQISNKKMNNQGLGMGLFIVKNIVESLQGKIEIQSEINTGTNITIFLPVETCIIANEYKPKYTDSEIVEKHRDLVNRVPYSRERKKILLVEDNRDMCNYLAEELSEDYFVITAQDGEKALKRLETNESVEIILSDVMMDNMDGFTFYELVSKNGNYSDIPFIFLTARSNDKEKIDMLTKGASDYLYKPFDIEELKAKIESVLKNVALQRKAGLKDALYAIQDQIISKEKNGNRNKFNFEFKIKENGLSKRQIEIINLVDQGLEYKQIADQLNISVKTVHRHIQILFEKFGVHSKIELIKTVFRQF